MFSCFTIILLFRHVSPSSASCYFGVQPGYMCTFLSRLTLKDSQNICLHRSFRSEHVRCVAFCLSPRWIERKEQIVTLHYKCLAYNTLWSSYQTISSSAFFPPSCLVLESCSVTSRMGDHTIARSRRCMKIQIQSLGNKFIYSEMYSNLRF